MVVEGGGGGMDWESVISRYELIHIGRIHSKVLLHSPGNHIQYPVINQNGKVYMCVCVCVCMCVCVRITLLYSGN